MERLGKDIDGKPITVGSRIIYAVKGFNGSVLRRAEVLGLATDCNNCYGRLHLRVLTDGDERASTFHYGEQALVIGEKV